MGREGVINPQAGHRSRGRCERSVLEFASGEEFAPSWMAGFKSWRAGGAEICGAKAKMSRAFNCDVVAAGGGWRDEIPSNFTKRGWVLAARDAF